jgi:hypothetical protein
MNCPGSVALCAKLPKLPTGRAAAEGTRSHQLCELMATGKLDYLGLVDLIGTTSLVDGHEIEVTEEMVDSAVEYKDLVEQIKGEIGAMKRPAPVEVHIETKVYAKAISDRVWGTADCVIFQRGNKLVVIDHKYGKGVVVEAEDNEQGRIYIQGAMDTLAGSAFDTLEFIIHQPRAGGVRRVVIKKEDLAAFCKAASAAAVETDKPGAKLDAGDWCRWCGAQARCPLKHALVQEQAGVDFSAPVTPKTVEDLRLAVRLMSDEQLVKAKRYEDPVSGFFDAVNAALLERHQAGSPVPGTKLVEGRSNQKWTNEDGAKAALAPFIVESEMMTKPELLSPNQIEKKLGKKHKDLVASLTFKPEGKKSVVLDTDPRPEVATSAADDFSGENALPTVWPQDEDVMSLL